MFKEVKKKKKKLRGETTRGDCKGPSTAKTLMFFPLGLLNFLVIKKKSCSDTQHIADIQVCTKKKSCWWEWDGTDMFSVHTF